MAESKPSERLIALDVFRGMTVAGMLLVNNPGSWGAIYPPLEHATWNGWTPTDLIFPFFLFIVGVTTHLSLSVRRRKGDDDAALRKQVIRRGILIVLIGWGMSAFPYYPIERFTELRLPGVLPRIGVVYLICGLLTLNASVKQIVTMIAVLLYGYWFAMTLLPVPGGCEMGALCLNDPPRTLAAWLDRALLDGHLWKSSKTWDPEGPLSTVPAIGTAMLGVLTGRWLAQKERPLLERLMAMSAVGALLMVVGLMWNWSFPINKGLWTSSYVVFTAGMAALAIATITWIIDVQRVTWWTRPFVIYGVNPMVAFAGSGIMARIIYSLWKVEVDGKQISVEAAVYKTVFLSWLEPRNASLAFAICFVAFWYGVLAVLYRRNWILKV